MKIETELGSLLVRSSPLGWLDVLYTPSDERLPPSRLDEPRGQAYEVKLVEIHATDGYITIFPTDMTYSGDFLESKYTQVKSITVRMPFDDDFPSTEDDISSLFARLPSCFAKDYDHGLGFKRGYRYIVHAIEALTDCEHLIVEPNFEIGVDPDHKAFYLPSTVLESLRKSVDRVASNSGRAVRAVNAAVTRNFLAQAIGAPEVPVNFGRSPLRQGFTKQALLGDRYLPEDEQELFLDVLKANARALAVEQPKRVALAQQELELANLDTVIDAYEGMMRDGVNEASWQTFFSDNPFVLSLGFGYPVIRLQDQAFMGGRDISGKGDKIADFLFKNRLTNNSAIVEIKTPRAMLLNETDFRDGVYAPNRELAEGVSQVLDQKHRFEGEIAHLQRNSKRSNFETYAVHCCLLIGLMPKAEAKRKSLELFRGNSKAVDVVTFDELLEKLRDLRAFLQPETVERQA